MLQKSDPFEAGRLAKISRKDAGSATVSAHTGEGINDLLNTLVYHLTLGQTDYEFAIPTADGKAVAWLHRSATVTKTDYTENDAIIHVTMGEAAFNKFKKVFGIKPI